MEIIIVVRDTQEGEAEVEFVTRPTIAGEREDDVTPASLTARVMLEAVLGKAPGNKAVPCQDDLDLHNAPSLLS